jgi:hypothetical protein
LSGGEDGEGHREEELEKHLARRRIRKLVERS